MKKVIRRKVKPGNKLNVDLKTSTQNLMLNIIIFVLFVIVIYLTYSIFIKLQLGDEENKTPNSNKQMPAEIIQVEVLNGCGVSGLADRFTDYLRSQNFQRIS